jgi:hypothetical protein
MSFGCSVNPYPAPVTEYLPDIVSITLPPVNLTEGQLAEIHTAQDQE